MTNQYIIALAPDADRYNTDPTTDRVRCPNAGKVQFLVTEGAGGTGTAALTVSCFAAATGGSGTAVTFRHKTAQTPGQLDDSGGWSSGTTVTPAAGASKQTLIEVRGDDLTAGKPFVELTLTEDTDSPVDASVIAIVKGGDYPGSGNTSLA